MYFCSLLNEGVNRFDYRIHGFCFMTNHIHLALQIGNITLSKVMQNLSFRFAQYINRKNDRSGHLFQGRYKAILVDTENYLLDLIKYIHFNPVRAFIVAQPDQYKWSSHLNYLGEKTLSWITCDWVLGIFSDVREIAISKYIKFMGTDVNLELCKKFQMGNHKKYSLIAEDSFLKKLELAQIEKIIPFLKFNDIVRLVCAFYTVDESLLHNVSRCHLNAKIRAVIGWLTQHFKIDTLTSVAAYFNRDVSGMIRTINRMINHIETKNELNFIKNYIKVSTSQA